MKQHWQLVDSKHHKHRKLKRRNGARNTTETFWVGLVTAAATAAAATATAKPRRFYTAAPAPTNPCSSYTTAPAHAANAHSFKNAAPHVNTPWLLVVGTQRRRRLAASAPTNSAGTAAPTPPATTPSTVGLPQQLAAPTTATPSARNDADSTPVAAGAREVLRGSAANSTFVTDDACDSVPGSAAEENDLAPTPIATHSAPVARSACTFLRCAPIAAHTVLVAACASTTTLPRPYAADELRSSAPEDKLAPVPFAATNKALIPATAANAPAATVKTTAAAPLFHRHQYTRDCLNEHIEQAAAAFKNSSSWDDFIGSIRGILVSTMIPCSLLPWWMQCNSVEHLEFAVRLDSTSWCIRLLVRTFIFSNKASAW